MMSEDMVGADGGGPAAGTGSQTREMPLGLENDVIATSSGWNEEKQQLVPGIPDEITLNHITTKLPWRAFHSLSSVSRGWREVIHGRLVYEARVSSHSTEEFLAISHLSGDIDAISLYSMRDKSVYQLPGIPQVQGGVPRASQGMVLDGKLYVLGGVKDWESTVVDAYVLDLTGSAEMYVLDLAGQRLWKQCASMQAGRLRFGCGVLDKKIYVFGGTSDSGPVRGAEVYDPELDVWSSIPPLKYMRFDHHVTEIGEELFVYGGSTYDDSYSEWKEALALDLDHNSIDDFAYSAWYLEVYHPRSRQWRKVDPFGRNEESSIDIERMFMAQGKFHVMSPDGIYVQDAGVDENLWADLHSFVESLPDYPEFHTGPTLAVDDKLLAVGLLEEDDKKLCLLECHGFGSDTMELMWERVIYPLSFHEHPESSFMCPIRL